MSAWPSFTVADLQAQGVLFVEDGNHGEYRPRPQEFIEGGTPFIRAADLADGLVRFDDAGTIDDSALRRVRKGVGRPGDILFSHKGTVGKLARVPLDAPPFVCSPQTTFWRVLDGTRLRRDYLYAFMRSKAFIDQWWVRKGETDMADYVSLTAQRQLRVTVPPIEVQEAIGRPLQAIDDLIDNTRRRIQVLEEMPKAIYREWFVRFRYPGHEADRLVESLLGPIPLGWEAHEIGDHLELRYGKALKADDRRGGSVAVVGSSGVVGWHDEDLVDGPAVVLGRKGNVGKVTWVTGPAWPIDTTYFVVSTLPLPFVYEQLSGMEFVNTHAAVPGLSRDDAYRRPFLVPPAELMNTFSQAWESFNAESEALDSEAELAARIRDLLLPKLVTGQIDVSSLDLDAVVGASA